MKRFLLTLISTIFVVTLTKAQDLPSYIPSDGLVAYYPFNGNANDASGNGNNGTVSGATLTSDKDGNTNKAYEFTVDENGGWGSSQDEITITSDPLMTGIYKSVNDSSPLQFQEKIQDHKFANSSTGGGDSRQTAYGHTIIYLNSGECITYAVTSNYWLYPERPNKITIRKL